MESPLARIMERLGYTKVELARKLGVPEAMITDICDGITVGEWAYRALIAQFKLEVELEQLIQAQKEFCATKQLERIEQARRSTQGLDDRPAEGGEIVGEP
jgi:plasmid maintenance system antidote protein VapI